MIRLFNRFWAVPAVASLLIEAGLLTLAFWAAYRIRFWEDFSLAYFYDFFSLRSTLFVAVLLASMYVNGLYDFGERIGIRLLLVRLVRALGAATLVLLAIYYVTFTAVTPGRTTFILAILLSAVLLLIWRFVLGWVLGKKAFHDRVLIVGSDRSSQELAKELLEREHLGYRVLGFVDNDPELQGVSLVNPRVLGEARDVCSLALSHGASRVVVAQEDKRGRLDMDSLLECKTSGIPVHDGASYYEKVTGKIALSGLRKSWLIFSQGFVVSALTVAGKRLADISIAVVGLFLAAPLMALTALAIKLDSRGSIFYRQERVGLRGEVFSLWKFRSMQVESGDSEESPMWAEERDPRITRVGNIIRRFRIDETPQLWNVLVGDMSIVGPRPEREVFVQQLIEMNPIYRLRHVVRPGVTGWAQVQAPYAATFESSIEKLQFDLFYIKNMSFFLDLSILASTVRIVLIGRGAR